MKKYVALLFLLGNCYSTYCQTIDYSVEGGAFLSGTTTPFWQYANQNGEVSRSQATSLWAKSTLRKSYATDSLGNNKLIDWGGGATGILSMSNQSTAFLAQLYAQLKIWKIELSVGRRYEQIGLVDQSLSSGNFSFSNNALPIPKIQLASMGFVDVPLTKRLLSFRFNYMDGQLGETPVNPFGVNLLIKDTYLHQKSLYGRFGKPHWKLKLFGGFCHQVMWGGEYQIWPNNFDLTQKERYWGVVSGGSWQSSRIGNHVANLDVGFSYRFPHFDLMFYRQSLVEDGALYRGLSNIVDGLNGLSIDFKQTTTRKITLEKGVMEILYTYSQGGDVFDYANGIFGKNNYFNHYVYLTGWSYQGRTLGTPFIMPTTDTRADLKKINKEPFTNNNRLFLLHLALKGKAFDKYTFLTKLSFSKNAGIYDFPFPNGTNQFSGFLEVRTKKKWLGGCELMGSAAIDVGKLVPNQVGIYVGIRKQGHF